MQLMLRGLAHQVGIPGAVEWVPSEYWPNDAQYDDIRHQWMQLNTELGPITVGWCKRVIVIRWTEDFGMVGAEVVHNPDTAYSELECHAWGWAEAALCLERLWYGAAIRGMECWATLVEALIKSPKVS